MSLLSHDTPHLLLMAPHWVPKVWGGRGLEEVLNKPLPGDGQLYGESWEVADLPEGQSRIATGPWAGSTLRDVVNAWGESLYGDKSCDGRFPLLVKFLDARDDLSVQVHPGAQHEAQLVGARSKDESWIITHSHDGAIYHGLKDDHLTAEHLRDAISDGACVDHLRHLSVHEGDVVHIPPGTIHAILSGVMLLEIQQPSDTTYRVYDYQRPGLDGHPRPLHLNEAMTVMTFGEQPAPMQTPIIHQENDDLRHEHLIDVPAYSIDRLTLKQQTRFELPVRAHAQVMICLDGVITLTHQTHAGTQREVLQRGQTAIIPALLTHVQAEGQGQLVLAH